MQSAAKMVNLFLIWQVFLIYFFKIQVRLLKFHQEPNFHIF